MDWMTNDPATAKALKAADARYDAERNAAAHLPLADKVVVYRNAKARRADAYRAIMAGAR